ncbi:MAG: hypothetical protein M1114_06170 [Candidatus Dependentiae bacterium]|nr:hypothetical protein [Candidatus Dependentiae bacterium]
MKHFTQSIFIFFFAFFSCAMDIPIKKLKTVQEAYDALGALVLMGVDDALHDNTLGQQVIWHLHQKFLDNNHIIPTYYLSILKKRGLIKEKKVISCFKSKYKYVICKYVTADMVAMNLPAI